MARTVKITTPPDWRYVITIRRAHRRKSLEAYAFGLKERLPRCRIPLRAADPDAVLDIPAVFNRCYDVGGYDLLIDYTQEPSVTLTDEEKTWLGINLQEQGFRSQ